MTVCRFFLQGNCKFGDNCKNEHPGKNVSSSRNPFAPLQNAPTRSAASQPNRGSSMTQNVRYKLDKDIIATDLSKERPQWILSAYGPGRDAPVQLFGGHTREQSFEELRLRHYELAAQNRQQEAIQEAQSLVTISEQQILTALNDLDGAIKYIINGENEHPNRIDICKAKGSQALQVQNSSSIQGSAPALSQPSDAGPVFGKPSSQSSFGQTSGATPIFGQPSAPSTFGLPSAPAFGQPSIPVSTFGQPTATSSSQSSIFGQPARSSGPPISFNQQSSTTHQPLNPFGNLSGLAQSNQFARNSTPASSQVNPFRPPSVPSQPSVFGKPSAPVSENGFGRHPAARPPTGPSQPATFPTNPFARPVPSQSSSASRQPSRSGQSSFGQLPSQQSTAPKIARPQSHDSSQIERDANGKVLTWNGKPVSYIKDEPCFKGIHGDWQKIWFPDGPPVFTKTKDLPYEAYDEATKESFRHITEFGNFKDGRMPDLPPRKEWCTWNF